MFRLTREVRFALNPIPDDQFERGPSNSYGGFPTLTGLGIYMSAFITLRGDLDPRSQYLENIKKVDEVVREYLPDVVERVRSGRMKTPAGVLLFLHSMVYEYFRDRFESIALRLTPFLTLEARRLELPMIRLSQKFEFSASHRLHNPALSDDENRRTFGKCNNPLSHGHNYELQVTLLGTPGPDGQLIALPDFERTVAESVIDRVDHKYLNSEVPEFRETIPSVENIARVIYGWLKPRFTDDVKLASVTVWETPKTWCEYSE